MHCFSSPEFQFRNGNKELFAILNSANTEECVQLPNADRKSLLESKSELDPNFHSRKYQWNIYLHCRVVPITQFLIQYQLCVAYNHFWGASNVSQSMRHSDDIVWDERVWCLSAANLYIEYRTCGTHAGYVWMTFQMIELKEKKPIL